MHLGLVDRRERRAPSGVAGLVDMLYHQHRLAIAADGSKESPASVLDQEKVFAQ